MTATLKETVIQIRPHYCYVMLRGVLRPEASLNSSQGTLRSRKARSLRVTCSFYFKVEIWVKLEFKLQNRLYHHFEIRVGQGIVKRQAHQMITGSFCYRAIARFAAKLLPHI